jgi:hypothetical protein
MGAPCRLLTPNLEAVKQRRLVRQLYGGAQPARFRVEYQREAPWCPASLRDGTTPNSYRETSP